MDIFDKCYEFSRAEEVMAAGLYPYFTPISEARGNRVKVRGREMILIGSNNYLGLIDHPKVMQAAKEAIDRYGVATCGSRFLTGTIDLHEILEERLARFMNKEAAVTFSTGYQTNLGIISSLAGKDDVVITDRMDHASIIDACRLSKAEVKKFKHNDLRDLERVLSEIPDDKGKLIVVDGVFSMEGDIADLPGIVPLAKKYKARIMVDDAHGLGVLGKHGRGTAEHFGLEDEVDLVMGTFSKSFVSIGGFVVGKKKVVSYIKHHARSLIFSAAATPASVAAVLAALEVIETEPERRERLWQVTNFMRESFQKLGFNTGPSQTPIIPILIGDDEKCFAMWKTLRDEGIFTTPVIHPAVPHGQALIRTSYSANHTDEELRLILAAFEKCGRALGIIP
ncbi:MAG: Aminotransferase class II, serine palmitoyltransferase like [Candidatus Saccharicenans subterraneus]|uniref:Aminotransferase class II, serine palmitoyltransferase like n=1 Tax=Candidatus Saccharicenans subterraneus TaxID=2508984 RepID=A0A3E2BK75_9BACT|nr:MAG: Aminotransferase class II, serine palmitoyltransferase like [Candidatus Saccharicenans subterraneum]